MTAIYMSHEKHGHKVAISETEAAADEKNGWVRYNPNQPDAADDQPEEPQNALTAKRKYTKKAVAL